MGEGTTEKMEIGERGNERGRLRREKVGEERRAQKRV